uniref:CHK kinase-like domain-containing protein n=1 Tax=Dendroctonus ponderosae TaxID=77166 RepID=J3JUJ0_DENPD|nr:unknown [Dendroctonus ponderosae]
MAKSKVNNVGELLTQSLGEDVEVLEEETAVLTAPGEHYGSVMLALNVKIKRKKSGLKGDLHLVAKLIPANEMLRLAFDIPVTFKKEVFAYKHTIPELVALQKEHRVPEEQFIDNLLPKCFGARVSVDENKNIVDEDAVLIFENLKLQGFITEDRLKGFDLSATRVILQDLARYHAVPIALKLLKPHAFKEKVLPATVSNKGLEQLPPEVGTTFHNAIMEGAREMPELQPYLQQIQKIVDDGAANPFVNRSNPNEPWGTMCHADFWVSNTMIQKDQTGRTVKNKIVDLQLLRYWSCCCDLVFFLFTSVINTILDEHFDDFLRLYHETFLKTLADFRLDLAPFSWENFLEELNEVAPTELYHVLIMLKPICTEKGKVTNSSEEFQDSDWSRKDLLGPNHRRKLKDTVLSIQKRGWL